MDAHRPYFGRSRLITRWYLGNCSKSGFSSHPRLVTVNDTATRPETCLKPAWATRHPPRNCVYHLAVDALLQNPELLFFPLSIIGWKSFCLLSATSCCRLPDRLQRSDHVGPFLPGESDRHHLQHGSGHGDDDGVPDVAVCHADRRVPVWRGGQRSPGLPHAELRWDQARRWSWIEPRGQERKKTIQTKSDKWMENDITQYLRTVSDTCSSIMCSCVSLLLVPQEKTLTQYVLCLRVKNKDIVCQPSIDSGSRGRFTPLSLQRSIINMICLNYLTCTQADFVAQ